MDRHVSILSGCAIQLASAARRLPSDSACRTNGAGTTVKAPGVAAFIGACRLPRASTNTGRGCNEGRERTGASKERGAGIHHTRLRQSGEPRVQTLHLSLNLFDSGIRLRADHRVHKFALTLAVTRAANLQLGL